jgi:uncharacterized RDD family membrane protein YckC
MDWYYAEGEKQVGPVDHETFKAMVKSKKIASSTLVWRTGMEDWRKLGDIVRSRPEDGKIRQGTSNLSSPTAASGDSVTPDPSHELSEPDPVENQQEQRACSECGKRFSVDDLIHYQDALICSVCKPLFVQKIKEGVAISGSLEYAGFWIRFGAKFIDGIILMVVNMATALLSGIMMGTSPSQTVAIVLGVTIQLLNIAIPAAYTTWFIGKFGATPGKMACKLRVVTSDGGRVSYPRALGRNFAEWLSWMIMGIGYLMAAFDDEKRTLHDRICDTRVVIR